MKDEDAMDLLSGRMYFSYSSFFIFDGGPGEGPLALMWTEGHSRQGFARRESHVQFGTLIEYGYGGLTVRLGCYESSPAHERVIEVPLRVSSGQVVVLGGPDDLPGRRIPVSAGHYRLVVAQGVTGDKLEVIDIYFEALSAPLNSSRIVVADAALDPPVPLLETVATG